LIERRARVAFVSIATLALTGCGTSPITSARIEAALAPTFANLVHIQMGWLGLPPMPVADFGVEASCRRLSTGVAGSGEWTCLLSWQGPDRKRLRDNYELFVTTDGCYTASAAVENVGGPTLRAEDGTEVRNLLYAFEGCFDIS
jgi:hypothetical protein